jgi:hypothetical protein
MVLHYIATFLSLMLCFTSLDIIFTNEIYDNHELMQFVQETVNRNCNETLEKAEEYGFLDNGSGSGFDHLAFYSDFLIIGASSFLQSLISLAYFLKTCI